MIARVGWSALHLLLAFRPSGLRVSGFRAFGLVALGALVLGLAGCGVPESEAPEVARSSLAFLERDSSGSTVRRLDIGEPGRWRELIDPDGEVTTLSAKPERIVSQSLAIDEVLLAVAEAERIVAITKMATEPSYSSAVLEALQIGSYVSNSSEHILGLRPDLVFVTSYSTLETVHQLRRGGATVVQLGGYESLQAIEDNIRLIGFAIGEDEATDELLRIMHARIERVRRMVPRGVEPPRVISYSEGSVMAGRTTFSDVMEQIGAINVPAEDGLVGWPRVSVEQVVRWDPDFFFLGAAPGQERLAKQRLLASAAIARTSAAKEGRVVVVPSRLFTTVSHHVASFVELAASELYGISPTGPVLGPDA